MKLLKHAFFFFAIAACMSSCGVPRHATLSNAPDLSKYKYVYIVPTAEKTSVYGGGLGFPYGAYSSTSSTSITPSDAIAGRFMKQGFIRIPELDEAKKAQTVTVTFGESGRKKYGLAFSMEVTIQLMDASTGKLICTSTAEGLGYTETDDVRLAINKCLDAIFK